MNLRDRIGALEFGTIAATDDADLHRALAATPETNRTNSCLTIMGCRGADDGALEAAASTGRGPGTYGNNSVPTPCCPRRIDDGVLEAAGIEAGPTNTRACPSWAGIPCRGDGDRARG